jgi:hypothetical protein
VSAPKNVRGRRSSIPSHVLTALLDHLLTKPDLYLDEMVDFVWDQYELVVSVASVRRSLKAYNWFKKKNRRVARERDPELRDACLYKLSEYKSFQLVLWTSLAATCWLVYDAQDGHLAACPQFR